MGDIMDTETVEELERQLSYLETTITGGQGDKTLFKQMSNYTGTPPMAKTATNDYDEFKATYDFMKERDKNNTLPPFSRVQYIVERRGKDMMGTKGLTYTEFILTDNQDKKYYVRKYDELSPLEYQLDWSRSIASDLKLISERNKVETHIEEKSEISLYSEWINKLEEKQEAGREEKKAEYKIPQLKVKWILLKMHWTFDDTRYMKLAKQLQRMLNLRERPPAPESQNLTSPSEDLEVSEAIAESKRVIAEFNEIKEQVLNTLGNNRVEKVEKHLIGKDKIWETYEDALSANQGKYLDVPISDLQGIRPSVDSFF